MTPVSRKLPPNLMSVSPTSQRSASAAATIMCLTASTPSRPGSIGTAGVMHLSTLTERGTFSAERAAALLVDEAAQETLIANVVTDMAARGYQALDVDFEYLGAPLAAAYAAFLGKLRAAVNASGWPLLAALAPKTSREQAGTLYEGHDYAAVAANTDAVLLMTYGCT